MSAGYRRAVRLRDAKADANKMCSRPWMDKLQAQRQGVRDAKRIQAFVYARVLAGDSVGVIEAARMLARGREYITTMGGMDAGTRPTHDEMERARLALSELGKHNKQLKRHIVLDEVSGDG